MNGYRYVLENATDNFEKILGYPTCITNSFKIRDLFFKVLCVLDVLYDSL
jgi:hypothetical protein